MSKQVVWFLRGDGLKISTTEGSASYDLMMKDGGFTLVMADGVPQPISAIEPDADAVPKPVDLRSMKKAEPLGYAAEKGIEVSPKATVAGLIGAIEAGLALQVGGSDEE